MDDREIRKIIEEYANKIQKLEYMNKLMHNALQTIHNMKIINVVDVIRITGITLDTIKSIGE